MTALNGASRREHLNVVNLLLDWEKIQIRAQIRKGFNLTNAHGSLYFPIDLVEMVLDFVV